MNSYKAMQVLSLDDVDTFYEPDGLDKVTLDRPAIEVVTDFHYGRPMIIESDVTIDEAKQLMHKSHVYLKLVVDKVEHILGLVSLTTLESQDVLQLISERNLSRTELTMADVMTPREKIHALSYSELQASKIGDVLHTLRELGERHILVLDEEKQEVCGIVSANDIARYLHVPVNIEHRSSSFAEVVQTLTH